MLDQFSRNMFRDTPKAFASDEKALQIAKLSIEKGFQNQVDGNAMWYYIFKKKRRHIKIYLKKKKKLTYIYNAHSFFYSTCVIFNYIFASC